MSACITPANNSVIRSSLKGVSDARLVSAAKCGDPFAFFELSRRHSNKILWRAYRIVKNLQDAEDIRQESLMKAFIHLKDFEERASFSSWLTRIAINSALMSMRKKRRYIETSIDVANDDQETGYRWEPQDPAESS
jgi:RNA polymerase sigma-70 factor, ECF subfamily